MQQRTSTQQYHYHIGHTPSLDLTSHSLRPLSTTTNPTTQTTYPSTRTQPSIPLYHTTLHNRFPTTTPCHGVTTTATQPSTASQAAPKTLGIAPTQIIRAFCHECRAERVSGTTSAWKGVRGRLTWESLSHWLVRDVELCVSLRGEYSEDDAVGREENRQVGERAQDCDGWCQCSILLSGRYATRPRPPDVWSSVLDDAGKLRCISKTAGSVRDIDIRK
jgi:hypothetical protein